LTPKPIIVAAGGGVAQRAVPYGGVAITIGVLARAFSPAAVLNWPLCVVVQRGLSSPGVLIPGRIECQSGSSRGSIESSGGVNN
jgi:hypothetical protein